MELDVREINAVFRFMVRERTHPECPSDRRFVSRFEEIPGEWATRAEAEDAIIEWILADAAMEGK